MTGIITQILNGAVKIFDVAETDIEAAIAKIKGALPASAQGDLVATATDLKQAASDALTTVASAEAAYAPTLAKVVEAAADDALGILLNGYSVPLIPLVNGGIDKIVDTATATLQAWAVSVKAQAATTTVVTAPKAAEPSATTTLGS